MKKRTKTGLQPSFLLLLAAFVSSACGVKALEDTRQLPSKLLAKGSNDQFAPASGESVAVTEEIDPGQESPVTTTNESGAAEQHKVGESPLSDSTLQNSVTPNGPTGGIEEPSGEVAEPTPVPTRPPERPRQPPWGPIEFWEVTQRSCLNACHNHRLEFRDFEYIVLNRDGLINSIEEGRMPKGFLVEAFSASPDKDLLLEFLRNL